MEVQFEDSPDDTPFDHVNERGYAFPGGPTERRCEGRHGDRKISFRLTVRLSELIQRRNGASGIAERHSGTLTD